MLTLHCPICGHSDSWPLDHQHNADVDTEQDGYGWRLCRKCGNAYPTAQPDLHKLSRIWEKNRLLGGVSAEHQQAMQDYRLCVSRIGAQRALKVYGSLYGKPPGRFLDIACGLGETVRAFGQAGWQAEGVDADPSTLVFHQRLGIRTQIGQIETLSFEGKFNLIQISHAIYFITDPMQFLERVRNLLADDGLFCVSLADFMSATDLGLPSYAHSFFPTGDSMRYALARAGFDAFFRRTWSGTIYIAARKKAAPLPSVNPGLIRLGYQTKQLRYALFGRPNLLLRQIAKRLLGRR